MKRICGVVAVCVLAFPLSGCWKDQRQAVAGCNAAYLRNGEDGAKNVQSCIEAHGYRLAENQSLCAGSPVPARDPYCYEPNGFIALLGYHAEMFYTSKPLPPLPPKDAL